MRQSIFYAGTHHVNSSGRRFDFSVPRDKITIGLDRLTGIAKERRREL